MTDHKKAVDEAFDVLKRVYEKRKFETASARDNTFSQEARDKGSFDLSEVDKAHLELLRAKLDMEMLDHLVSTIDRASETSDRLGNKVFWLNVIITALTAVIALSAVLELFKKVP